MKKEYIKPQIEIVRINQSVSLLAGSVVNAISGDGILDLGGSSDNNPGGPVGRAPEFYLDEEDW